MNIEGEINSYFDLVLLYYGERWYYIYKKISMQDANCHDASNHIDNFGMHVSEKRRVSKTMTM
jgi:hypothetical protein